MLNYQLNKNLYSVWQKDTRFLMQSLQRRKPPQRAASLLRYRTVPGLVGQLATQNYLGFGY